MGIVSNPKLCHFPELPGCPQECLCTNQEDKVIVDCENRSMTKLPLMINIPQKTGIINVAGNAIMSMDFDVGVNILNQHHRVSILNLQHNDIKIFKTLSLKKYFPLLTTLILSHNQITHLKASLSATLKSLNELDLSNNLVNFIEENVFKKMKNLLNLNLSGNKMNVLHEDTFNGLSHLLSLNMSCNKMKILNISLFQKTPHLVQLDLQSNSILTLEPENATFPKTLSVINLSFNRIRQIPPLPPALVSRNESFLNLHGNPTFCGCRSPGFDHSVLSEDVMCKIDFRCHSVVHLTTNGPTCKRNATKTILKYMVQQKQCQRPRVFMKLQNLLFKSTISCNAIGYPTPVVSLMRLGDNISVVTSQKGQIISTMDVKTLFTDICANVSYKCRSENQIGESETLLNLNDVSKAQLASECELLFAETKPTMSRTTMILFIFSTSVSFIVICCITFRIYICHKRTCSHCCFPQSENSSRRSYRSSTAQYEEIELQVRTPETIDNETAGSLQIR